MRNECYNCHNQTVEKLIKKHQPDTESADLFRKGIQFLFDNNYSNPVLATHIHRYGRKILNNTNLYLEEKKAANDLLLNSYIYWQQMVNNSTDPFFMAAKLAVAGNIIDYGAHSVPQDIKSFIEKLVKKNFAIDHSAALKQAIAKARSILYLGDNAGEIVFDKLLIETIKHPNVTFAVRGEPVINDVTLIDAKQVGMDKMCKVISNGYDSPSTLLNNCSTEFLDVYHSADLIISKGMGNFEGLMQDNDSNLFFMLMAKCKPIAELLGAKKGDMVIKQQRAK